MTRGKRNDPTMKKWLAIARDDTIGGSHILIIEAVTIRNAYEECEHQCIMHHLGVPEQRAIYEIKEREDGAEHICTVLDAKPKEGLFNGRAALSIGPRTNNAEPWSGAILR